MEIQLSFYPQTLLLVLSRVVAITAATLVFGKEVAPLKARVLIGFAITMIITPVIPGEWARLAAQINTLPKMFVAMLGELLLGFAIAMICELFSGIFMVMGHVAGWASSLTMARTLDPVSGTDANILILVLQLVFLILVWVHGGHLILLRIIHSSFFTVPPTWAWYSHDVVEIMVTLGRQMFEWGLRLSAPLLGAALVVSAGMGLVAKMAPEFNILFLSLPIRLFIGVMMFGFFMRFGAGQMREIIKTMLEYCMRVMA